MLNKIPATLIIIFTLALSSYAGDWRSYTNSNTVKQVAASRNEILGATSGGVVAINYLTGEITKLTNTDGLGGIDLRCVDIDSAGNTWFGTGDGWLSKLSLPLKIKNYAIRDSSGLIGRAIRLFDLKSDGEILWIASDLGVSKFLIYSNDGEIKDTARRLGSLPQDEDATCVEVVGDYLWAGTAQGLAFIDKDNTNIQYYGNWRSFSRGDNGLNNDNIKSLAAFQDTLFAATSSGVYKFITLPDTAWVQTGLVDVTINNLTSTSSALYASTNGGIFRLDSSGWLSLPSDGLPGGLVNDMAVDSTGTIWVGTPESGIGELSEDSLWTLKSIPGPASNFIGRLALDSVGGLWMTHDTKGMSRFYDNRWRIFNSQNSDPDSSGPLHGLLDNGLNSISVAPNGNVWAGSFGDGLYEYDWTSWNHWDTSNSPMFGVVQNRAFWAATAVNVDDNGNIWVSAFGSADLLLMGVFAPQSPDSIWQLFYGTQIGLNTNYIKSIKTRGNIVWVGRGDGLDRLDNNGTPFDISDDNWVINISDEDIPDMALDPIGSLWFGSATGLYFVPASADAVINIELPSQISGSVNAVAFDGVGQLWVGTVAGMGVLKPNRDDPQLPRWGDLYTSANSPLLDNRVNDIAIDIPTGTVYVGTNGGLSVFESGVLPPSPDLSDMEVYPNPVVLKTGDETIEFKRVPSTGTMTIYTVSGDIITHIDLASHSNWDMRNSKGERVAGGIYIFHVRSGDKSGSGKFVVIK
jgi:ligand-binding sensor domain-containing protein